MENAGLKLVECVRCLYNTSVFPGLTFDEHGVCRACRDYEAIFPIRVKKGGDGQVELERRVAEIARAGRGRDYDCIIGVSGGTDSTYVAYLVKQYGLRPLAVHLDNGWDSEMAVRNIQGCVGRLGIDLETHVIDWQEFRDLQLSFLRGSTPDGEVPSDHAIQALMWRSAAHYGVRTIVSGSNFTTESTTVPPHWAYGHSDWRYIHDVHSKFGSVSLSTYPHYTLKSLMYVNLVKRVRSLSILNYLDYDKQSAQDLLRKEVAWQDYGGKHHESIYTRFFQGYVLPLKFGIDKRYGHLSDLIRAGQLSREQAVVEISRPPYPEDQQQLDRAYVTKKLGITDEDFSQIMELPVRTYRDYKNNYARVQQLRRSVNRLRARGLYDL